MAGAGVVNTIKQRVLQERPLGIAAEAVNVAFSIHGANSYRKEGNSVPVAVGKSVADFLVYEALGPWGLVYGGAQTVGGLLIAGSEHSSRTMKSAYNRRGAFGSGYFDMTQAGYTMRQRSLNAIRNNGMNIQSALGNEARTFYRG